MTTTLVSVEEYLHELAHSDVKLEYLNGEIVAMAGAQPAHNIAVINLIIAFGECIKKHGCLMMNADQLVHIQATDSFTFPDVVIVCQKPLYQKSPSGLDALLNPTIIVEVLSDSTELYDRSEKFEAYQKIESLKEYVLVSSKKKKIEVYKRNSAETWLHQMTKEGKISIGECEIDLDAIYERVEFG